MHQRQRERNRESRNEGKDSWEWGRNAVRAMGFAVNKRELKREGANAQLLTVVSYGYERMRRKKKTNLYSPPGDQNICLHQKPTNSERRDGRASRGRSVEMESRKPTMSFSS